MSDVKETARYRLKEYCVIYLDVMGQKRFLSELEKCSEDEANSRIEKLSAPISRFVEGIERLVKEIDEKLNVEELKDAFDEGRGWGVQQFSDSTLLYVKMGSAVSSLVILRFIEFVTFRMLDSAADGFLLRGGIAVGKGWEIGRNCLCGSVIGDAYKLESEVSCWGRISVSQLFAKRVSAQCKFLNAIGSVEGAKLMGSLESIIRRDLDGVYFIDYLNPSVEDMYCRNQINSDWFIDRIEQGGKFIKSERDKYYEESSGQGDSSKLAMKYGVMYEYWLSRLLMWSKKNV